MLRLLADENFPAIAVSLLVWLLPHCSMALITKQLSPSDLIITTATVLKPPTSLSADEVKEDIELLRYSLERGYVGRKYTAQPTLNAALKGLEEICGSMPPEQLNERIDSILWTIPDNHLKSRLNGQISTTRMAGMRREDAGKNAISPNTKIWEVRTDLRNGYKVLYISILSFPFHGDPIWKGFLNKVRAKLKASDFMVLDLRENNGGDDTMGFRLARLCYGNRVDSPLAKQMTCQTPEAIAAWANKFQLAAMQARAKNEKPPAVVAIMHEKAMKKFRLAIKGQIAEERIESVNNNHHKFNSERGYNKPIFILIDGGCCSSGESTVDAFESNPLAIKVGKNTSGMKQFGDVGIILLPHSKIQVQIPTHYNEYTDKRFIEKIGLKPDVETSEDQDAYDLAVKIFADRETRDRHLQSRERSSL